MEQGEDGGCSETVVKEKEDSGGEPQEGEGVSDIPEGGGGGGSRGKPKRERGERSRLEERLRALRHRSHLPTCDKSAEASAAREPRLSVPRESLTEFIIPF